MPKWIVPSRQKIKLKKFKELFYLNNLSIKEVADYFKTHISSISSFRKRHNLPIRGWSKGHPFLGKHHSEKTKNILRKKCGFKKELNPNWNGGEYIDKKGYKWIRVPDKTINSYRGYMKEHRYVMSKFLKRPINKNEHIHHINKNKLDNRTKNLSILKSSEHSKLHFPKGSKFGINSKIYRGNIHKK